MTELPGKPPLYFKITIAALSLLLFVFLAEATLRIIDPELFYKNQFFPLNRDVDFPEFYEKDSKLFWKLRPSRTIESRWFSNLSYQINSKGLRGPEIDQEKKGIRILALGNSCTFGWGVSYENCWTVQLQSMLMNANPDNHIEVINAGVPGYTSFQGKILFEKLTELKPDIVLITYGWNDHWQAGHDISDAEQNTPPKFMNDIQNELSKLMLYKFIRKITLSLTEDTVIVSLSDLSGRRRVSPEEFSENLKEIIKTANTNGIKPILLVPPIASLKNYFRETQSNFHLLHQKYQDVILRVGEYESFPVVNLQTVFDNYTDLFEDAHGDPIHFNDHGHQIVAEELAKAITPQL
ncbi:MAG: SGNH/GDSL hydrolase family protein [Candidatus Zixiibacteriota bacterium]